MGIKAITSIAVLYRGDNFSSDPHLEKKNSKGKKSSLKSSCEGRVVDIDHTAHNYQIEFKDPDTLKYKTTWFKVDDVTKTNGNAGIAQEQSCGGKRKTFAGELDHEKVASNVRRTEAKLQNPSLLDMSIDQNFV